MGYYDKLGRKASEDKATYKVNTEYVKEFKRLMKTAKDALCLQNTPAEWAIKTLRNNYGATVAGYINR